jgi:hypothetical protein
MRPDVRPQLRGSPSFHVSRLTFHGSWARAENDAAGRGSFAAVERSMSDKLLDEPALIIHGRFCCKRLCVGERRCEDIAICMVRSHRLQNRPLCSRNARPQKNEREQADRSSCSQSPHDKKEWKDTHVGPVLPERAP